MIIDAHSHVWPDEIAAAALGGNRVPGLTARGDGTVGGLTAAMDRTGVDVSCCLGIANRAKHVDKVNAFVAGLASDRRIAFGTVHVDLPVEENIASLDRHGVTAVKIHPLFQNFALDDPRLQEIFEAFGDRIAVIAHVGAGGDERTNALSGPGMIADIARRFPALRLVACHFGGYRILDEAEEILRGTDVVLETSWPPSLGELAPERVRRIIRDHGADRIVFGSDWPMTDPGEEIAAIEALGLTDDETKSVLGGTMARVLGVPSPWAR
ncbi:amidohydrolase family protein [Actinomadura algeriensis]|uniref:TIM-barrel fold metal-dependent hydrolase n=1 Tax=Actinomadura algeriensis TaxID=1679523 RepID=A0ABR9K3N9_9ACTN|nr:amidohydrolase family protein [Actinomadura algeriensis]MBE1536970.1 putative TIM-barrel fold metal-dependent hydrolase [Actinomadura algeriensis]